jgi:hypothetical protein
MASTSLATLANAFSAAILATLFGKACQKRSKSSLSAFLASEAREFLFWSLASSLWSLASSLWALSSPLSGGITEVNPLIAPKPRITALGAVGLVGGGPGDVAPHPAAVDRSVCLDAENAGFAKLRKGRDNAVERR